MSVGGTAVAELRHRASMLRQGMGGGRREDDSDLARQQRIGCRFVGCGLLLFCLLMVPVAIRHAEITDPWWTAVSFGLVATPAVFVVVSTLLPIPRHLDGLVIACACGYLVATSLWFPAWRGEPDDDARWAVWMLQFPSVPSFALVIMSRTRWALAALVVNTFLVHIANQIARYGEVRPLELLSAPLSIALAGVFLSVAFATVRNVRSLDDRHPELLRSAAATAADTAQEAERARFAALIHDRVIATLLAVQAGPPDPRLAAQARSALEELDRSRGTPTLLDAEGFAARIRAAALATSEAVRCYLVASGEWRYSTEIVDVMADCVGEATRNWYRHAGAGSRCEVDGYFDAEHVRVIVADDGAGFDPSAVDPHRFGIAGGIHARMTRLTGGAATVSSAPGLGTVVTLDWRHREN
ncbi:ATP-binding protein [Gordonia sp. BP-119]|uniref:sensor histidine kinase n=2 Tax=unclassified Gordonia (in: high G+C Gram-positive bacteria) TaxID=2657482 RepID=UPI0027DE0EB0|nr:ATP-binding protein [Gordonia sp. BP-119]